MKNRAEQHKGYFIYFDSKNDAIGMGEEFKIIERLSPKAITVQTIQSGVGSVSNDKVEIQKGLFDSINDPKNKEWLRDFEVKEGRVVKKTKP